MAKSKLGIGKMEIKKKFDSYEDACRYAKNNSTQLKYVNGKPKLIVNDIIVDKIYHGDYKTDWHIYILIVSM